MKEYSEMIKAELEAEIEKEGLAQEVTDTAKNPNKPTNAELVSVLEVAKAGKVEVNSFDESPEVGTKVDDVDEETKVATMVEDLNTMVPVIVTDHDTSISIEEDDERRVVGLRWGNPLIGMTTTNVALHGKLQYLPKGALIRLNKVTLADHIKDADGKEKTVTDRSRFSVADTTGWSEAEFEAHKKEQMLKRI